jgi:hypothetical protein
LLDPHIGGIALFALVPRPLGHLILVCDTGIPADWGDNLAPIAHACPDSLAMVANERRLAILGAGLGLWG